MNLLKMCFIFLPLIFTACATVPIETTWKNSPEISIKYEKGWRTLVNVISENFVVETLEPQSGYLKSDWKTTDKCWAGIAYGGSIPCKKERAIVRIKSENPFIVSIKVEVKTKDMMAGWFYVDKWVPKGSNLQMQNRIMETFLSRIKYK